jgi:hypothetical protein
MSLIHELRWRVAKDGLYQSADGGPFRRVATRYESAAAFYIAGMMTANVSDDHRAWLNAPLMPRRSFRRDPAHLMSDCIVVLKFKLRDRAEVIDVSRHAKLNLIRRLSAGVQTGGTWPGDGVCGKPHYLRRWLPGAMPLGRFIGALDERGWLIRGADWLATRQIVIPGYGRRRFYCLKLAAVGDDEPDHAHAESRDLDLIRDGDRPDVADSVSAAPAALSEARQNESVELGLAAGMPRRRRFFD